MNQFEKIKELLEQQKGMIQTAQVVEAGISKPTFYKYVEENHLEKMAHGIYISEDIWVDSMYIMHLRCGQIIYSHETALLFHDLTDREPDKYSVTVKTGYNPSKLKKDGMQVHCIKRELYDLGRTTMETTFGNEVPVYDMERTVCDVIRNRNNIEMQVFQETLKRYTKRKDKNLRRLMQYAKALHVEKVLRQYLEVLL